MNPEVTAFFDEPTFTASYVVTDPESKHCVIIDSVMDFDPASGSTHTDSADEMIAFIDETGLTLDWILETHVHADHLSAAPYIRQKLGGKTVIGSGVKVVQTVFGDLFNVEDSFARDGSQFDRLLEDGDELGFGSMTVAAMHTPGHTPACMTYVIGDAAFVGDTLFMPDFGTARTDFPGGSAATLYQSIQKILSLPPTTRLFMCHDYKAPGRDAYAWETTVEAERNDNIHVHDGVSEADFVSFREERDATLSMPKLILPSVQVNMRAGELPPEEVNGMRYLKLPLNAFKAPESDAA